MKQLYIIALVLLTSQGWAQTQDTEDKEKSFKHDIGLNAIGLFQSIFDSDQSDIVTPYLISYNLDFGKTNFRAAIGPSYSSSTETHEGFTDSEKATQVDIDARIGVGWDVIDERKWLVRVGADLVGGYHLDQLIDDTGFDKVTQEKKGWDLGAGPFAQVVFRINQRISLSTDAALYFKHFNTTENELFENFPDFNNQLSKTTGQKLEVFLPTSLFIHFHF